MEDNKKTKLREKMEQQNKNTINKDEQELADIMKDPNNIIEVIDDPEIVRKMSKGMKTPESIAIVRGDDGNPRVVANYGDNEFSEIESREIDNSPEEVGRLRRNEEKEEGAGTKVVLKDPYKTEISVHINGYGEQEASVIEDLGNDGSNEAISLSNITPQEQELLYEKYGTGTLVSEKEKLMSKGEIESRLADEPQSIRDEVGADIDEMPKNPTVKEFEETVEMEREKQEDIEEKELEEKEEKNDEEEIEEDNERYLGDGGPRGFRH